MPMRRTITTPNLNRSAAPAARSTVRSATVRKAKTSVQQRPKTQGGKSFSNVPGNIPEEKYAYLSAPTYLKRLLLNEPVSSPRQPASAVARNKAVEDFSDEISFLKKQIAYLTAENQALTTRCRQLKDTLTKKENELVALNDPAENAKLLQTLGENRPQTMRTFRMLHQRIYRLEERLQEKESEYNRLVTDMKFTRIEELRIQLEVTIAEVHRLQKENETLFTKLNQLSTERQARSSKKEYSEQRELLRRISTMGKVIKTLNDEKQELIAKNQHLLIRMQQLLRNDAFPKEDIDQELHHLSQMKKPVSPPSRGDPDLVARMVETTVKGSTQKNKSGAVFATKIKNELVLANGSKKQPQGTLASPGVRVKDEKETPTMENTQSPFLSEPKSDEQNSVTSLEVSSRENTEKLATPRSLQSIPSTKEHDSARIIQRAWRVHRNYQSKKTTEKQVNNNVPKAKLRTEPVNQQPAPSSILQEFKETEVVSEASTFVTDEEDMLSEALCSPSQLERKQGEVHMGHRLSLGSIQPSEFEDDFNSDETAN